MLVLFKEAGLPDNPICSALAQDKGTDNSDLIELLLEQHPDVSKLIIKRLIADGYDFMHNSSGISPLHHKFEDDQLDLVKMFIDAGYDPNALNGPRFPLRTSLNSAKIVQFLLDNGANPQPSGPYVTSALDLACIKDDCPLETLKVLIKHESTKLTMNQITANSPLYMAIKKGADIELTREFVIKALQVYIKDIRGELGIGVFFSKEEKMNAAKALLSNIQNGTAIDLIHNKALKDGRLCQIAALLPSSISKTFREKLQEIRQENNQNESSSKFVMR